MKRIVITVLSLMLASVLSFAENGRSDFASLSNTPTQTDKVKIRKEDLPEAVRNTLNGESFRGWIVQKAFKLASGEFEVELRKGSAFQTIQFDKDGKMI